ncbi:hypothetical protein ABZX66_20985 [Micromonospora aurantiaca]|uniref:hypothetical protein n=1 Tax=Micromonospora aurantiaca (nom. illeg.) TaxID=47850 RepID=UPI0033BC997E
MSDVEVPEQGIPRMAVNLRAQRAPHIAVGALVLAAGAARLAVHTVGHEAEVARWTAMTAFVVAVVAATTISRKRRVFGRKATARALAFVGVAAVWLTTVATVGLSLGAVGVLMALGYGLHLHWWRENRIEPVTEPVVLRAYTDLWHDNLSGVGGPLAGTRVMTERPVAGGVRLTVRLVPGKQELATVTGALGKIRTGLGLRPTDELMAEHHPKRDQSYIRVTILEKSPVLTRDNVWPGPITYNPKTGRVALGPFVDGDGYAQWQVYTNNSIWGGFLVGGQGSGKTRMVEGIVMSVVESTPTVVWFADGHGETGASSKLLRDHCDYFAGTPDQLRIMLAGAHLVAAARFDDMLLDDLEGFTPTDDRPGLIIVIDECHRFFCHDDIQELAADLITEYRKVGITIIAATQSGNLDRAFGTGKHADVLRSALLTGNGVVLRIKSGSIKDVLKLAYDPRDFPPIPGYARMVDEERGAAFRGFRVTDEQIATLPKRMRWRSLSAAEGAAFGPGYADRKGVRGKAKADALRRRQARQAGVHIPAPAPTSAAGGLAAPQAQAVAELLEDVVFPVWPGSVEPEFEPTDSHRKVLDAIGAGRQQPKDAMEAAGIGSSRFYQLAGDLLAHGYVMKEGRGPAAKYRLTERALIQAA